MDLSLLEEELGAATEFLERLEKQKQQKDHESWENDANGPQQNASRIERLFELQSTTESIALAKDYLSFLNSSGGIYNDESEDLFAQARLCKEFAQQVILKHTVATTTTGAPFTTRIDLLDFCPSIYEEEYLPSFQYLRELLVTELRIELQSSRYPKATGCQQLLDRHRQTGPNDRLCRLCQTLDELERTNEQVEKALGKTDPKSSTNSPSLVLVELFRPLLDRVHFHFVGTTKESDHGKKQESAISEEVTTATRIDRLPEWLLTYITDNFLQESGPYEVILSAMGPQSAVLFFNEVISLIQWILVDQRNFFDDPMVAGPNSNPQILMQAMEQFLEFDSNLLALLFDRQKRISQESHDVEAPTVWMTNELSDSSVDAKTPFLGLMDVLVASNEELFNWWIRREKEFVFATLFPDEEQEASSNTSESPSQSIALSTHVSPRTELFCALIRSVQRKASTLTAPEKYLREVAVPLCSQFVEALHATSVDLRNRLIRPQSCREQPFSPVSSSVMCLDAEKQHFVSNITEWIQIINGTKLASQILLSSKAERIVTSQSDHDLGRFGQSLERLVEVMMDEFSVAFVETTLMEHAKLANYLMLASHLLATPEYAEENRVWKENDLITTELGDTQILLQYFHETCDSVIAATRDGSNLSFGEEGENLVPFAPIGMRSRVADRLADKLLEVALDSNHVTPDIWLAGALTFTRDVRVLLGSYSDTPTVTELLNVTEFMTMDYESFSGLFAAIGGLMASDEYVDIEELSRDTTLYEQALSMLKAKNVKCSLAHAVSILNRRRN